MPEQICIDLTDKERVYQILLGLYIILDYWLGKTDKVKAASLLELVFPALQKYRAVYSQVTTVETKQVQQQVQGGQNGNSDGNKTV